MSLESEIKKLTEAVIALNASMSGQPAQPAGFAPPAPAFTPPVQQPAQQFTPPVIPQQPAAQYTPPAQQPAQQPGAMTHADAQRALGMVMQQLGPSFGPTLQGMIAQYGNGATTLSAVPAANLAALVQAAQAQAPQ